MAALGPNAVHNPKPVNPRSIASMVTAIETAGSGANTIIGDDVMHDAYGNEIKIDKKKTLTDKEKKKAIKNLQKK